MSLPDGTRCGIHGNPTESGRCVVCDGAVCDFCNTDDPVWRYPAPGFEMADFGVVKIESRGGWLACEKCAALIEDADGLALTRRSAELYCEYRELRSSNAVDLVAAGMAEIHERFLALRGERVLA